MTTHTVIVWDEPQKVTVHQKYKTVWIATGDYKGRTIIVEGRSHGAALIRWREAATYRGNDGVPD